MKIPTMAEMIRGIICSYAICGFHIALIHVHIQFKAIKDRNSLNTKINVVSKEGHISEIEQMIHVLKEQE